MAATTTQRQTAEERREAILGAAQDLFAQRGLYGTSTDEIARRAGISQPYLFRLFGTKKELFIATVERCLSEALGMFKTASAGLEGEEALLAIGRAYADEIVKNPRRLQAQMQAYAACDDPEIRQVVKRGFGRLAEHAERVSGAPPDRISAFFAKGMLLNVITSMELRAAKEGWAKRLLDGCRR